jgi:hypothetical protein
VGLIRTSYYEDGKTKHRQLGRITNKTLNELKLLQLAFKNQVVAVGSNEAFAIVESKEYGASNALFLLAKSTGLYNILSSSLKNKSNSVLAMIIGILAYSGSKLSLCGMADYSSFWSVCGINKPDVDTNCYEALDELISKQKTIQKKLAKKHLSNGNLVLYDITSSYFEGEYTDCQYAFKIDPPCAFKTDPPPVLI